MKYGLNEIIYLDVYGSLVKHQLNDKKIYKAIKKEYKKIMKHAKDIGQDNNLLSSYTLGAFFIALNRCNQVDVKENYKLLESGMKTSKLLKAFLGDDKSYFSEKKMNHRRKWSKLTHEHKYENDWVVDIIEKDDKYQFGFNYLECGVCKLCQDEGVFELAKYLCKLDYLLVDLIGIKLDRTMTLANGDKYCDFRFKK